MMWDPSSGNIQHFSLLWNQVKGSACSKSVRENKHCGHLEWNLGEVSITDAPGYSLVYCTCLLALNLNPPVLVLSTMEPFFSPLRTDPVWFDCLENIMYELSPNSVLDLYSEHHSNLLPHVLHLSWKNMVNRLHLNENILHFRSKLTQRQWKA